MSAKTIEGPALLSREDADGQRWVLNFGPQHPATHTTLRLVLELDGERIVRCIPDIGYLHSGFEKLGEHLDYNQYVVVVDRMNYISPLMNEIAWHHACERLFGIEVTPRCKVIRTILGELARISDHMLCIGAAALDVGAYTPFLYAFEDREIIYDLIEDITGGRFHPAYLRLGGLARDMPDDWPAKFARLFEHLPRTLEDIEALLTRNRIFMERTRGIGCISREDAINWSLTGPIARASGVERDLRKDEPYLCFERNWDGRGSSPVQFKVPVSDMGDAYARFLVRLEEVRQSLHIIRQLVDNIPPGPVNVEPELKVTLPEKQRVWGSIEGLIHHFEIIMSNRGWRPPAGEVYAAVESPNGELGFYIVSAGDRCPYRVRCRPPSFINYQVFPKLVEGHQISDVVAVLGSLNIIAAELDR